MEKRQFTYTAGHHPERNREQEKSNSPLPPSAAFRLRFLLCVLLLAGAILADRYAFKEEETAAAFQYLEKDIDPQEVGHCIYDFFVIK